MVEHISFYSTWFLPTVMQQKILFYSAIVAFLLQQQIVNSLVCLSFYSTNPQAVANAHWQRPLCILRGARWLHTAGSDLWPRQNSIHAVRASISVIASDLPWLITGMCAIRNKNADVYWPERPLCFFNGAADWLELDTKTDKAKAGRGSTAELRSRSFAPRFALYGLHLDVLNAPTTNNPFYSTAQSDRNFWAQPFSPFVLCWLSYINDF